MVGRLANTSPDVYRHFRQGHVDIWRYLSAAAQLAPGSCIVDIGCGPGVEARAFTQSGIPGSYLGFDVAVDAVTAGQKDLADEPRVEIQFSDANNLPLPSQIADLCTFMISLHQMLNPDAVLIEAYRVLKPSGTLAILFVPETYWISAIEYRLFQGLAELERSRSGHINEAWLRAHISKLLPHIKVSRHPYLKRRIDQNLVEACRCKYVSTIRQLSNTEFTVGLRALQSYVDKTEGRVTETIDCLLLTATTHEQFDPGKG